MKSKGITFQLVVIGMIIVVALVGMLYIDHVRADTLVNWYYTGSLNDARGRGTATLLQNGKVLVAGGLGNGGVLASAELYDPATGNWSRTGDMNTARNRHTATVLPDGKVLVTGGDNYVDPFSTAELYDPDTGTWSYTGSMNEARCCHTALLLLNGKVLIAGGGYGGSYFTSAELYDPDSGTWSTTGSMNVSRDSYPLTQLPNGKVLAAAGFHDGNVNASAELYDPDTGTWSTTGDLNEARADHTAILLPNGKVLIAGSDSYGNTLASAELYDPADGTWSYTGSLNNSRGKHIAILLPSGKVLVAGGLGDNPPSAELYDPDTGTWSNTGNMNDGRSWFTATLLPYGDVLAAGGDGSLATTELYIIPVPPESATIIGSEAALVGESEDFTAWVEPISTTLPLTYVWEADGQVPITQTGGLTDTINFSWDALGTQIITVTASNIFGSVMDTHMITITNYACFLPTIQNCQQSYPMENGDFEFGDLGWTLSSPSSILPSENGITPVSGNMMASIISYGIVGIDPGYIEQSFTIPLDFSYLNFSWSAYLLCGGVSGPRCGGDLAISIDGITLTSVHASGESGMIPWRRIEVDTGSYRGSTITLRFTSASSRDVIYNYIDNISFASCP